MKTKILLIFVAILAIAIYSCQKNEIFQKENQMNDHMLPYYKSNEIDLTGVEVVNGILKFPDNDKLIYVVEGLDAQCDAYWNSILSTFGDMEDSIFDALMDSLGFSVDQPIIDFEDGFNFYSLRKYLEEEEDAWLKLEYPDCCLDPDNHYIIDETFRAVLNTSGEIVVDSSIFKFYASGTTLEIKNLDFNLLDEINRADTAILDTLNDPNLIVHYKAGQDTADCRRDKTKRDF